MADVAENIDPVVALPSVGGSGGTWLDMGGHGREQRSGGRISEDRNPTPVNPWGSLPTTTGPTRTFFPFAPLPLRFGSAPPMQRRRRCLVGVDLYGRCKLSADISSLAVANSRQAANKIVTSVRSKIAPAVTDVRKPRAAHLNRPSLIL
jgi:hypothetical protein